jgi:hypothetical protein
VKVPPPAFSVRERLPKIVPLIRTGTPRKVVIGGWFGGKPTERACSLSTGSRIARGSSISRPRIP